MRRSVLASAVRGVIEPLEPRRLFSAGAAPAGEAAHHAALTRDVTNVGTGTGSIFGTVYQDLNGNNIQDLTEPAIGGATVFLDLNTDGILQPGEPSTITDAFGGFGFTGLAAGTYNLVVIPQSGFHQATGSFTVAVTANQSTTAIIGENNTTVITGVLYNDINQDDLYDYVHEPFLAGDIVYVDLNNNGVFDGPTYDPGTGAVISPGEPSVITNNVGGFRFDLAQPGSYFIRAVPRPGFHQDPPGYVFIDATGGGLFNVNIGENNATTLSGVVYEDLNGNGVQDAGEPGVAGETVFLDTIRDGIYEGPFYDPATGAQTLGDLTAVSDANGQYIFTGVDLAAGNYHILTLGTGASLAGGAGMLVDKPGYIDVTIAQNQDAIVNVGEGVPVHITGTLFNDANANGVQDPGETGLAGQNVFLDINNNGIADGPTADPFGNPIPPEPIFTTDAVGNYDLTNVGPGTYTVRSQGGGLSTGPLSPGRDYTVTAGSGATIAGQNFGFKTGDLTATILNFPTRQVLTTVRQKAVVRVTNVGSLPVGGLVGITLYAGTTPNVDTTNSFVIGALPGTSVTLKPGQSKVFRVFFGYPTQMPLGDYYIAARVVGAADLNNSNDLSAAIGPAPVGPPYIDLNIAYQTPPPLVIASGLRTPLSVVVSNLGNVDAVGTYTMQVYASQTPTIEPNSTPTWRFGFKHQKLKPNTAKTFNLDLPNSGTFLGYRYLIVTIDAGSPLGETNLLNNVALPPNPVFFR